VVYEKTNKQTNKKSSTLCKFFFAKLAETAVLL